jgi:hypothetical protein
MYMTHAHLLYFRQLHRRPVVWLAWAAALSYSSWPLGYILNPVVSRHDLASQLEAMHQPFNWVFIGMDVLTGVAVTFAGIRQIGARGEGALLRWCAAGYVAFGWLTALAALVPVNDAGTQGARRSLIHNPPLIVHDVSSNLSAVLLFLSALALGAIVSRRHAALASHWAFGAALTSWIVFGSGSLAEIRLHISNNLLQYCFITVCSLLIVLVIATIEYLRLVDQQPALEQLSPHNLNL